jgi:hypothetical protein
MKLGVFNLIDRRVGVKISAVICDAPARAMLKCCKGHTAFNSCERCVQKGHWTNKITFELENAENR